MIDTSFWKGKKVFITGHTGFKGSWLLQTLLKLDSHVTGYALQPAFNPSLFVEIDKKVKGKYESYISDICDKEKLKKALLNSKPDIVFHLAAQPLVRESYRNPIGTWMVNVMGTLFLLEQLKEIGQKCSVIVVTTDKVYKNKEWIFGYRENDSLGGYDPYSASKAAVEICVNSWRSSFCKDNLNIGIATARAGNVIGGGDWSKDRLIPDIVRSLSQNKEIIIRNPESSRPWQHVLEPIFGYLLLAEKLYKFPNKYSEAFNFGPNIDSNKSVCEMLSEVLKIWPGNFQLENKDKNNLHEAKLLNLQIDKSYHYLGWKPYWDFTTTVKKTIFWYQNYFKGLSAYEMCSNDIDEFQNLLNNKT